MRWCIAFLVLMLCAARALAEPRVDFARDVLPILSDKCFHCHGPDEKARKAKLRLDTREGALGPGRKGKPAVVPGKTDESPLVQRVLTRDEMDLMPPPDANRPLTEAQKETLKRWVEQGAAWGEHWAFRRIGPVDPPKTRRQDWGKNPIDQYVLTRLEAEGLSPAKPAGRERLLRRLTFDVTGLAPTPKEVEEFVRDESLNAVEKVIDRLLASPRFGERMASEWLDLARYADTHGFQMDRYRPMWPYRDWVIEAFNQNLSFDQFVTWQLAGDLLPNATKKQRLATAFNRLHLQNEEGGIVEEEFRVAYVVDRVNTFGTAFLGLTLDCSRCHDHKYDPVSMRDYYSLFAFFQNIDESGQTTYFTDAMPVPTLLLSNDDQDAKLADLKTKIDAKQKELELLRADTSAFEKWLTDRGARARDAGLAGAWSFDTMEKNQVVNAAAGGKAAQAHDGPKLMESPRGKAAALSGDNGFTFPGVGHFSRVDPFTLSIWVKMPARTPRAVVVHHSKAPIDAGSRGYELLLENGRVALGLHHMWPRNSMKVLGRDEVPVNQWTHIAVTYDGSSRAAGARIYINGQLSENQVVRDGLWKDITYGGEPELAVGYRFRDNGFKDGQVDELRVYSRQLTVGEVAELAGVASLEQAWGTPTDKLTPAQRGQLAEYFHANVSEPAAKARAELHALRRQQSQLINPIPEAMVMEEMAAPKPAFVLKRGAYDAPGDAVSMDTPKALPPFPADAPRNRLGLARWLVMRENPLMARVTVNRLWQQMFGRGIVETPDNFGSQGAQPTHPELLDHLAIRFMDSGWDVKAMLKYIALSATYQQDSRCAPELLARDPANQLLARGPSRRLSAEMLRDQALQVGGLLVEKLGGPSVKPYQPPGLWEEIAMGRPNYGQGKGADLYRRSLYTFWKRTVPHPAMITFDAAERNVCIVKRQSTSTPLQALALLNDVQHVEAARFLAQRMMLEGGASTESRVAWAFVQATSRKPTEKESAILRRIFAEQRDLFAKAPAEAEKLLAQGDSRSDARLDKLDLAALTIVAQAILNHDESLMRR